MIETYIVDSFTDKPFKGNPAGVCVLKEPIPEEKMQSIAAELGLSETAFIHKLDIENKYSIRFFSPKMEIPLCGHATLASSKILFTTRKNLSEIEFVNVQHLALKIRRDGESIVMEFPVYDTEPANAPAEMLLALGIKSAINTEYNKETNILLIEIEGGPYLKNLKPDYTALYRSHASINGVLVTAASAIAGFDFESRYFWPWSGTNEDPVTGGTHTFLTKYWSKRTGKSKLKSFQCSERTGFMDLSLTEDNKVHIKSTAEIIFEGTLRI
jgi:PhzF family phenazine biosynthesis protein